MMKKSSVNALWKAIGSARPAIFLLWAIIAIAFAGALLPSEHQPLIYSSIWFYSVIGLFALNLFSCSVSRLSLSRAKIGSVIAHSGILVILAGSLVSAVLGFRGHLELSEGQSSDWFMAENGWRQLPFTVTLEDFSLKWYDLDSKGYPVRVRVEDADFSGKFLALPAEEYRLGESGYSFSVTKYLPHFSFDDKDIPVSLSEQPINPALLVNIHGPRGKEDRWVFSLHPDVHMGGDRNIRFVFDLEPHIKEYRSSVTVHDGQGNTAFSQDIKVNAPLEYRGYRLYQSRYDSRELSWTGLDVVYDPGVRVVFSGFIMLNLGIIAIFIPKLRTPGLIGRNG